MTTWFLIYVLLGPSQATANAHFKSFDDCFSVGMEIIKTHKEETGHEGYMICHEVRGG